MKKKVIFIGGFGRSGSTLLEGFIQQHYDVIGIGELKYIWKRGELRNELCGCGEKFRECDFWQAIVQPTLRHFGKTVAEMEALRLSVERHRLQFLMRYGVLPAEMLRRREEYSRVLAFIYERIFEIGGADTIIDSSKDPAHIAIAAQSDAFDFSLIHLVRDPRAVAFSFRTPKIRREVHWTTEYMDKLNPAHASLVWRFINSEFERLTSIPSRYTLRYEDFVADQSAVLEFLDGLGLERVDEARSTWHTVSGNPSRFAGGPGAIREDVRWKTQMGAGERFLVDRITGGVRRSYGYS